MSPGSAPGKDAFLSGLPAFAALSDPGRAALRAKLMLRRYRKGEPIFDEGAAADSVHLLRAGLVKTVKQSPSASLAAMEIVGPGQFFGMIAALDGKPYLVSAVPLCASEAYRLPSRVFTSLLDAEPRFARLVRAALASQLRQSQSLRALATEPAQTRVAHVLLALTRSMGPVLRLRRGDVAEIAGCTHETAIRTLASMRERGIIAAGWKRLEILDARRLAVLVDPA